MSKLIHYLWRTKPAVIHDPYSLAKPNSFLIVLSGTLLFFSGPLEKNSQNNIWKKSAWHYRIDTKLYVTCFLIGHPPVGHELSFNISHIGLQCARVSRVCCPNNTSCTIKQSISKSNSAKWFPFPRINDTYDIHDTQINIGIIYYSIL